MEKKILKCNNCEMSNCFTINELNAINWCFYCSHPISWDGGQCISANYICYKLDISLNTLNTWYKWQKLEGSPNAPRLPKYYQKNAKSKRYWEKDSLVRLEQFKNWVPKGRAGVMGNFTQKYKRRIKNETK